MGGAIYNGGKLTMYECILTNNGYARPKDYVFFMAPNPLTHSGGAILNYGIIEMHACIVTANSAAYVRDCRPTRAACPCHLPPWANTARLSKYFPSLLEQITIV